MPKLRVRREAHRRKAHVRKGGIHVNKAKVPASTFLIKDRGKPGRTPEKERFFYPKVHTGWTANMPAGERRRLVKASHKGDLLASARSMISLANVQHRTNPDVAAKAKADALYFYRQHKKSGSRR